MDRTALKLIDRLASLAYTWKMVVEAVPPLRPSAGHSTATTNFAKMRKEKQ
jgi:hypothetical protein